MMRVVVKEAGFKPVVRKIAPGGDSSRAVIGGYLRAAMSGRFFDEDDLVVYCDDDGMSKDLPLNLFRPSDGHPILGTVIAVKIDGNLRDDVSMTLADAEKARAFLDTLSLPGDKPPIPK